MANLIHPNADTMAGQQGKGKLHKYFGERDHSRFKQDVANVLTISPGGAKVLLKSSREFVHQLIETEELEAWVEYSGFLSKRAGQIEVSVLDVIKFGLKSGRIERGQVLGYFLDDVEEVRELMDNYLPD